MCRKTGHTIGWVIGGLIAVSAVSLMSPAGSRAQSASFDSRWLAISPAQKADRIDAPKAGLEGQIYFFDLPTVQTTVVIKSPRKPSSAGGQTETQGAGTPVDRSQNGSMKRPSIVPARFQPFGGKQKDKLPVGCESSFSPVTTPVMANVSARCLS